MTKPVLLWGRVVIAGETDCFEASYSGRRWRHFFVIFAGRSGPFRMIRMLNEGCAHSQACLEGSTHPDLCWLSCEKVFAGAAGCFQALQISSEFRAAYSSTSCVRVRVSCGDEHFSPASCVPCVCVCLCVCVCVCVCLCVCVCFHWKIKKHGNKFKKR